MALLCAFLHFLQHVYAAVKLRKSNNFNIFYENQSEKKIRKIFFENVC